MMTSVGKEIRRNILEIAQKTGHGHIPSCFSVVEMLCAVYDVMRQDPLNPKWEKRDLFILSKGHASLAYYCVLAHLGYFDPGLLLTFGAFGSSFGCHPDRFKIPGVEASTGSLGHGIGIAVGTALALKIKKETSRRVFTLIGDGESNEGSVWEAVMVASHLGLDNLTILYDDNRSHGRGLQIPNPVERFKSFACRVYHVNGHSLASLKKALRRKTNKVQVLVCRTVKGYGCKTMARNHYEWHRKSPNETEYCQLLKELA